MSHAATPAEDPRITSYALGEMDAAEQAAFELETQGNPEIQSEIAAVRAQASVLGNLFSADAGAAAGLTDLQRARVERAVQSVPTRAASRGRWMQAAALVLGVLVSVGLALAWVSPESENTTLFKTAAYDRQANELPFGYRGISPESDKPSGQPDATIFKLDDVTNGVHDDARVAHVQGISFDRTRRAVPPGMRDPRDPVIGIGGGMGGHGAGEGDRNGRRTSFLAGGGAAGAGGGGHSVNGSVDWRSYKHGGEQYAYTADNPYLQTTKAHTSTFSLDVDTASYANVRRFLLHQGVLPPAGAVRIEELVNYFTYAYAPPAADAKHPFATHVAIANCPWSSGRLLARIAIKGKVIEAEERPAANLVFLVDVSGSMSPANKLPLVKQGLRLLIGKLDKRDRVALVTYAGTAGLALPSTSCMEKETILKAIDGLASGGSTNGEAGIKIAYRIAKENFIKEGVNRVLLATDGDFNVGLTEQGGLVDLIQKSAKTGTYLSILGFGMGNYKDGRMEALSNKGNGTYAYIDSLAEAKKVLVEGLTGELVPIAKDVKVQVFFNPKTVLAYRLIGYENRVLAAKDFNDDRKDAGDVGAGHTVTALYELVPVGAAMPGQAVDPNPFVKGTPKPAKPATQGIEHPTALFQLRLRYKRPDGDTSTLLEQMVEPSSQTFDQSDEDMRFAAAVAAFGMRLRRSPHKGRMGWAAILEIAESAIGTDPHGRRGEFLQLVKKAQELLGDK